MKIKRYQQLVAAIFILSSILIYTYQADAQEDTAALKDKINQLESRINQLEGELSKAKPSSGSAVQAQPEQWDPFAEMEQMQKEMNRMFNDSVWRGMGGQLAQPLNQLGPLDPDVDFKEGDKEYTVKLDMPGMDKSDIKVEVVDGGLMVSGEKRQDKEEGKKGQFFRRERSFGYFSRLVPMPEDAKTDQMDASYKNGVLTITVPRMATPEKKTLPKRVEIK